MAPPYWQPCLRCQLCLLELDSPENTDGVSSKLNLCYLDRPGTANLSGSAAYFTVSIGDDPEEDAPIESVEYAADPKRQARFKARIG